MLLDLWQWQKAALLCWWILIWYRVWCARSKFRTPTWKGQKVATHTSRHPWQWTGIPCWHFMYIYCDTHIEILYSPMTLQISVIGILSFLCTCICTCNCSWTNSTHEAYYKRDISQRLKPHSWTAPISFHGCKYKS